VSVILSLCRQLKTQKVSTQSILEAALNQVQIKEGIASSDLLPLIDELAELRSATSAKEAMLLESRALTICKSEVGEDHPSLANRYRLLAN
jgi:hypothetical protein